jgi:hypothetical protein
MYLFFAFVPRPAQKARFQDTSSRTFGARPFPLWSTLPNILTKVLRIHSHPYRGVGVGGGPSPLSVAPPWGLHGSARSIVISVVQLTVTMKLITANLTRFMSPVEGAPVPDMPHTITRSPRPFPIFTRIQRRHFHLAMTAFVTRPQVLTVHNNLSII